MLQEIYIGESRANKGWPLVLRSAGLLASVGALVAFALLPERFLPDRQGIDVEGALSGEPVEIQWTGVAEAPFRVVVTMKTGLCDIAAFDARGALAEQWSAQVVTYRGGIQPGGGVRLIPRQGAEGYFHVRMGHLATWGPVLMATRVVLFGLAAALFMAWLFGVRVNPRQWDARRRREIAVVGATTALTGLVLYSIVHEAGHLLLGWLWGGTPAWDQVSWTLFSGEEPHASFRSLPREAEPWMAAGGMLLPTLVGCVLVAAGLWRGAGVVWWPRKVFVTAGALLLLGNLGLFADSGHTLPLALHMRVHDAFAQMLALTPAVLTLAIYGYVGYRLRFRAEAPEPISPTPVLL